MGKKNRGRQKLDMKKLENESHLQVTFSKRRFGLFKKAEILMLVCSPGGNVYSFGHPSVSDQIDRFLGHNSIIRDQQNNKQLVETRPGIIQYLNGIIDQELANEEKEEHRKKMLDEKTEAREQKRNSYEKDVKELNLNETDYMICALQELEKKLASEMYQLSQVNIPQNYLGESSGFIGGRNVDVGTDLFDPNMNFPNNTPLFGYNNNGATVPRANNERATVPRVNNDGVNIPSYNNDGVIVPSYNNDGAIVPRSNNDGVIVPRSNMNDMSSYNFNQS